MDGNADSDAHGNGNIITEPDGYQYVYATETEHLFADRATRWLELCYASEGKTLNAQGRHADPTVKAAPQFGLCADHTHMGERF